MQIMHHPLADELPQYKDQIHDLKLSNSHFRRLAREYEVIDKTIVRAEQGIDTINDDFLSRIKKERLHLKDQIYQMIKKQ